MIKRDMFLPLIKEIDKKKALSDNLRKLGLERTQLLLST